MVPPTYSGKPERSRGKLNMYTSPVVELVLTTIIVSVFAPVTRPPAQRTSRPSSSTFSQPSFWASMVLMSNEGDGPGAMVAGGSVGSGVSSGGIVGPDGGGVVGATAMPPGVGLAGQSRVGSQPVPKFLSATGRRYIQSAP